MITALSIDFYKALPYNKYIENSIRKERPMIVKTAVRQYKTTDKEIFLQSKTDLAYVDKDDDVEEKTIMLPNSFLFAYEDQAWMIWNDLSVSEIEDYLAIGSASDVAKGVLFATTDKNPFDRIVTCIDAAAEATLYVDHGIDFLATKFYDKDRSAMCKALGLEQPKEEESNKKVATKAKKETKKA